MSDDSCGVYIMSDISNNVLYIGMSTQLPERIQQHKDKLVAGFTSKYNCTKLVYFESTPDRETALFREKQLKGWNRAKKAELIAKMNPRWEDLFEKLIGLVVGS
ncbi:MAG: GIY-YIG nuclease family protein [Patescibacteria group bacterium]|jgi:putative endonuclease